MFEFVEYVTVTALCAASRMLTDRPGMLIGRARLLPGGGDEFVAHCAARAAAADAP
jgi:hypothetical protein